MPVLLDIANCIPWRRLHFHLQSVISKQEKELEKGLYKNSTFCKDNILLNNSVLFFSRSPKVRTSVVTS